MEENLNPQQFEQSQEPEKEPDPATDCYRTGRGSFHHADPWSKGRSFGCHACGLHLTD